MLEVGLIGIGNAGNQVASLAKEKLGIDVYAINSSEKDFETVPNGIPKKLIGDKKDTRNFEVKNKADFFHCSSYTIFYDQMILYAEIRKGRSELRSNKLNYIAKREIGK